MFVCIQGKNNVLEWKPVVGILFKGSIQYSGSQYAERFCFWVAIALKKFSKVYMCGQDFLLWLSSMFSFVSCGSRTQDSSLLPGSIINTVTSTLICYTIYFPWGSCWGQLEHSSPTSPFLCHPLTDQRSFNYPRCHKCITLNGAYGGHSRNITPLRLWSHPHLFFQSRGPHGPNTSLVCLAGQAVLS